MRPIEHSHVGNRLHGHSNIKREHFNSQAAHEGHVCIHVVLWMYIDGNGHL